MNSIRMLKMCLYVFLMYSYTLFSQPIVTEVSPLTGPTMGGNIVSIQGSGFTGAIAVQFNSQSVLVFVVVNDNLIQAVVPPRTPGTVNVIVTTLSGISLATRASSYVYQGVWFAYTTQFSSTNVIPINTQTNTASFPIIVGNAPASVAITPDGTTAYISVAGTNSVSTIDLATNTVIGLPIPVGSNPQIVAITPDGTMAYVVNFNSNSVTPIDLTTIPPTPGAHIPVGVNPNSIAITIDGKKAYVVNTTSSNVTVIDLVTQTPLPGFIPIGINSRPVAVTTAPDGTRVYVTSVNPNTVTEIDTATNTIVRVINLTGPGVNAITITSDSAKLYVTNTFASSLTPFNLITSLAESDILVNLRPDALALTPNQTRIYVAHELSNNVAVVDLTLSPPVKILDIPVGNRTGEIAITPDQAPFASFNVNVAPAGLPSTFDALSSASPVGEIVAYSWDFGDGTTIITSMPVINHSYLSPGNYNVTLVVTNTAGTSIFQIFTGQTMRNNGGPNAFDTQTITILPQAPIVTSLIPNFGFTTGGNQVTIIGANFTSTTAVLFGSVPANFVVISDTMIIATAPPGIGVVNVMVLTSGGNSIITPNNHYTYIPIIIPPTPPTPPIPPTPPTPIPSFPQPPSQLHVHERSNRFATQTEFIHILTWQPPKEGINPVFYRVYSNRSLTHLLATIPAQAELQFVAHNRKEHHRYVYFVVSVDVNGNQSLPTHIAVH